MTRDFASLGARSVAPSGRLGGASIALMVMLTPFAAATEPRTGSPPDHTPGSAGGGCTLTAGQLRTVTAITAPDVIALDDGTEVKLAGLLGARATDTVAAVADWPPETAAVHALTAHVLGQTVSIHTVTPRTDRYRRTVAHVFVDRGGERHWVQGQLLADGHARAYALPDAFMCADELLAHEREARTRRAGIWTNAAYFERAAYRTRELMRLRGTFQIVSGRVRKVSEMKSAIYLNFGTDWHSDFTAGIRTGKGPLTDAAFAGMLRTLEGRRVRVRGWIERRNGPYVEIGHSSEIELLDDGAPRDIVAPSTIAGTNEKRPEQ